MIGDLYDLWRDQWLHQSWVTHISRLMSWVTSFSAFLKWKKRFLCC